MRWYALTSASTLHHVTHYLFCLNIIRCEVYVLTDGTFGLALKGTRACCLVPEGLT